jgi:four helix bundle protein
VPSTFRDLDAYRLAVELADYLDEVIRTWPMHQRIRLGDQLIRAADSVGANIAEATGRWHTPDKRRLLMIARGSLYELEHWLLTAERRGLLESGTSKRVDRVAQALNGMIRRPN